MMRFIWCLIPLVGWAWAAMAEGPAFDCAKAEHDAETAVCDSPALSELDRELARLYGLALDGAHMSEDRVRELTAMQRGWIKGRDDCWKSDLGLETCVANEYAFRIDALRTGYADARVEGGASLGPFAYVCDGLDAGLSASFVTTSAPMVVLRWLDHAIVLPQVQAGSGAKYASDKWYSPDGAQAPSVFWTHGTAAQFQFAGGPSLSCTEDSTD